jgi:hypothetical protein
MSSDEKAAAACCAAVLEAMREPGFRTVCVDSLMGDSTSSGLLFLECPLAALKTVAKLLPMTAERPPEQRFKPLVARARAVATSDVHLVRARGLHVSAALPRFLAALPPSPPRRGATV